MLFYQKVWRNNVWIFTKLCDNCLRFYVTYNNGNTKNRKFVRWCWQWKFATRKWYVTNDQNNTDYGDADENSTTIKFETNVIKSNLCDYSDAYIFVTGDITATNGNENTKVAFKNCAPFTKCVTHINYEHVDNADDLDIVMPMHSLIKYSDNYSDTSGSLWQFKSDESPVTSAGNPDDVSVDNSSYFKYKW